MGRSPGWTDHRCARCHVQPEPSTRHARPAGLLHPVLPLPRDSALWLRPSSPPLQPSDRPRVQLKGSPLPTKSPSRPLPGSRPAPQWGCGPLPSAQTPRASWAGCTAPEQPRLPLDKGRACPQPCPVWSAPWPQASFPPRTASVLPSGKAQRECPSAVTPARLRTQRALARSWGPGTPIWCSGGLAAPPTLASLRVDSDCPGPPSPLPAKSTQLP